ncbi:ABC transporter ATP-binding protein [uncultured Desulfuromusa sp.]|uniref:ABC transporter ATP-binding protein n=1 Tax=uncultured Desulfuromusa sp. TaxID=219183 RepID=UPI002AA60D99|nr:ABC transporter ATP-binding protein [uncultured Desulfuromusa sp.]
MKISLSDLCFGYADRLVLKEFNCIFASGAITAVLGVNGSGKTTLLKMMSRLLKPDRGCIFLDETDLLSLSRKKSAQTTGYISQTYETARLRVFDYLLIGRTPYRRYAYDPEDEQIVLQVLDDLELSSFADRWLGELSGGEVQKIVIARALVQQPEVLLLDEPTNNLDLKNQLEVMKILSKCSRQRRMTVIFSIHDINLALRFADDFLLLDQGQVLMAGDKTNLSAESLSHAYGTPLIIHEVSGELLVLPQ